MTKERKEQIDNMNIREFLALSEDERNEYYAMLVRLSNEHFAEYCREHDLEKFMPDMQKRKPMLYMEHFEQHYREWIGEFDNARLVECEKNISAFIDSELFPDCILSDEFIRLYDIIRDECVYRVSKFAESR